MDEATRRGLPASARTTLERTELFAGTLIGQSEADAIAAAEEHGLTVRIAGRDGESFRLRSDMRFSRVNLVISADVVTQATAYWPPRQICRTGCAEGSRVPTDLGGVVVKTRTPLIVVGLLILTACSGGGTDSQTKQASAAPRRSTSTTVATTTTTATTTLPPPTVPATTAAPPTEPQPVVTATPATDAPPPTVATTLPPSAYQNCNKNPVYCAPNKGTVGGDCSGHVGQYGNAPDGSIILCVDGPNATYVWVPAVM